MAIGAIAGGGVVLSLADVSTGQASVAAHVLAAPAQALLGAPEAAQPHAQSVVEFALDSGTDARLGAAVNGTNPKIVEPAGIAKALTEAGPNDASVNVATPPSSTAAPAENKTTKNCRVARRQAESCARRYGAWGWGGSASRLGRTASPPMPRIRAGLRRDLVALHHGRAGRRRSSSLGRFTPSSGQAFRGGWTVGAGVETLRAPNWRIFIWILGPRNYLMSSPVLPKRSVSKPIWLVLA